MRKFLLAIAMLTPFAALAEDNPGLQARKTIPAYTTLANPNPWSDNWQPVTYLHPAVPAIASGACGATTNGSINGVDEAGKLTIGAATTTACVVTLGDPNWTPTACTFAPASAASAATTVLPYISTIGAGTWTLGGAVLALTSWYYRCR